MLLSTYVNAQEKTISFIVAGTGSTVEEANNNALRSALTQAYAMFVSSDTKLLEDPTLVNEAIKAENNYLVKGEKLSTLTLPKGAGFFTVLKPKISIDKLLALAKEKGVTAEQKGGLFSYNINQQTLNEKNEIAIIAAFHDLTDKFYQHIFDYTVSVGSPKVDQDENKKWNIDLAISLKPSQHAADLAAFMYALLKDISLPMSELQSYTTVGKNVYPLSILLDEAQFSYLLLRNEESKKGIEEIMTKILNNAFLFNIYSGFDEAGLNQDDKGEYYYPIKSSIIGDSDFPYTIALTPSGEISNVVYTGTKAEKFFEKNEYFKEKFPFVLKLSNEFIGNKKQEKYWKDPVYVNLDIFEAEPGLIVSLDKFKAGTDFLEITYTDKRTLEEMNKIQAYTIITPDTVLSNLQLRRQLLKGAWQNMADTSDVIWFDENKTASLFYNVKNWAKKVGENEEIEEEYVLGANCGNSIVIETEEGEELPSKEDSNIVNYLTYTKGCWYIEHLSRNFLTLELSEERTEKRKYRKVKYSPVSVSSKSK